MALETKCRDHGRITSDDQGQSTHFVSVLEEPVTLQEIGATTFFVVGALILFVNGTTEECNEAVV